MKLRILSPIVTCAILVFLGCKKQDDVKSETTSEVDFKQMQVPNGFDYATTGVQNLSVHVELLGSIPYEGAEFDVCLDNPDAYLDDQEALNKLRKVSSIRLNKNGDYTSELRLPNHIQKIYLLSKSIGIPEYFALEKSATGFSLSYNPDPRVKAGASAYSFSQRQVFGTTTTLADRTWNNLGMPNYLIDPVYVNPSFLQRFKAALPKGVPVPVQSGYLNSAIPRTIILDLEPGQTADVNITFMFANSQNKNTLGYYWYPTDNPPASPSDIPASNRNYIFPSTSRSTVANYSGLIAGHTVELIGPNADGSFNRNTSIGFFLISNSFTPTTAGTQGTINTGRTTYYSDYRLNTAGGTGYMAGKKERMVTLYDESTNKIVWSIEDGTDGDYSDIAFFASWNPNEAVNVEDFPKLPTAPRSDNDYVYYPAKNLMGTLMFEDCWPRLADFDMNDMIVNHNYAGLIDPLEANKISEVNFTFDLASISAQQNNSFAVMIPNVSPSHVAIITNVNFDGNNVNSNPNVKYTVESGHTNDMVIRVFDGATTVLGGNTVNNTGAGAITRNAEKYSFTVKFNPSITISDFNKISPFLIPRGNRNYEIHLANRRPSGKANLSFFGTEDDNSSVSLGRYYLSNTRNSAGNITWAIDVPEKIPYPQSGASMTAAYPNFVQWAVSGATSHLDWFTNGVGNRVISKLVNQQ